MPDATSAPLIQAAQWPQDLDQARSLLQSYFQSLRENESVPVEIRHKDRAPELDALADVYSGEGTLLLAWSHGHACGCVAVHRLASRSGSAELKRLYVAPGTRGFGIGRALIEAASCWAREHGAHELLLDTLPSAMPEAVRLYLSLGFTPTQRYNQNEDCCFAFYRHALF